MASWPPSHWLPARGLRSIENIPGGATLYRVFFGVREKREARLVSFDDIDRAERSGFDGKAWALTIGAHLVLIGLPIIALMPAREPDAAPEEGMIVELVTEPGVAAGKGERRREAVAAPDAETAGDAAPAGLPILANERVLPPDAEKIVSGANAENAPAASAPAVAAAAPQPRELPAALGSAAGGAGTMSPEEARWEGAILGRIEGHRRYPKAALKAGIEDRVMLRLVLARDGKLLRAEVARSAGHPSLNAEVLALARRANPYPRPPASVAGETISMLVPVEFVVTKAK